MLGHSIELADLIHLTEDQARSESLATAEAWAAVWRCEEDGTTFIDRKSLADTYQEARERTGPPREDGYILDRIVRVAIVEFNPEGGRA